MSSENQGSTSILKRVHQSFREWLINWQDGIIWIPTAVVILILAYWAIPYIDPRSGIDGFGDLFIYLTQVVKLIVTFFLCWLFKRTYLTDLSAEEETTLLKIAKDGLNDSDNARWILIKDRLEWLGLLLFTGYFLL